MIDLIFIRKEKKNCNYITIAKRCHVEINQSWKLLRNTTMHLVFWNNLSIFCQTADWTSKSLLAFSCSFDWRRTVSPWICPAQVKRDVKWYYSNRHHREILRRTIRNGASEHSLNLNLIISLINVEQRKYTRELVNAEIYLQKQSNQSLYIFEIASAWNLVYKVIK